MEQTTNTKKFKLNKKFYNNQEAEQIEQQLKNSANIIPGVEYFRGKNNKITVFFKSKDNPFYLQLIEQGFKEPIQQQPFIQSKKKQRLVSKIINKYYKRNQNNFNVNKINNLSLSSSSSSSKKSKNKRNTENAKREEIEGEEERKYKDANGIHQSEIYKQQQQFKLYEHLVYFIQNLSIPQLTYSQLSKLLLQGDKKNSTDFAIIAFNEKQYVTDFLSQEIKDREVIQKFSQQNNCLNCSQNNIIASSQNTSSNKIPINNSFFENLECFDSTKNQTMINQSSSSNKVSIQKEEEVVLPIPIQRDFNYSQHSNCSINELFNKKSIKTTTTPSPNTINSNSFDCNSNNFLQQKIDQVDQIEQEMPNITTWSKIRQLNSLFKEKCNEEHDEQ